MASHLVLLGTPHHSHIPYFAMGIPSLRENSVEHLDLGTELVRFVGRRCAAWIGARAQGDTISLVATRNYSPPETTFHATWLRFRAAEVAAEFLDAYPQHRLDGRIAKLEADREALTSKLQNRLRRGDFKLGHMGDERERENLARKYVEAAEALRGFGSELKPLERASELAPQWQEQL